MRKACSVLMIALMLSFVLAFWTPVRAEEREVTILVYVCGTDLESESGEASGDIREMVSSGIGNSNRAEVLVATGGAKTWQQYGISSRNVQYYRLGAGQPELLKDAGRMNMGEANTLSSFLRYGIDAAPAKRYILVLWDHGGGPVHGICYDENYSDDHLTLAELKKGLTGGLNGNRLEIIGFDCCIMNCLDLCADLYGIADYALVSQEMVSGTGLNYDEWMKLIRDDPGTPGETIAQKMAESYVKENAAGRQATTATMSVIATEQMPGVMEAANAFSEAVAEAMKTNLSGVIRLRSQLTSFGEFLDYDASDLVDVEDMCDAFSALIPEESARLKEAARQAVCYNCTTKDIANYAHGLSFFLPSETIRSDSREILETYSGRDGGYAALAVALTRENAVSGSAMTASSYLPNLFYNYEAGADGGNCSGSFCDIWNGWYGDYCSAEDACSAFGGNIWAGLNPSGGPGGSIWDGFSSASGIWAGYEPGQGGTETSSAEIAEGGIWAGLPGESGAPAPTESPAPAQSASAAIDNIWAGLLNSESAYYQPGEQNPNVQPGISEAVTAEEVLDTANTYFSSATLSSQTIYSVQLNRNDLDHLSTAEGVLSRMEGNETIRLGNLGKTTIDWSTGLIFSMFDGSWPILEGQMVRAEFLYGDEEGNTRFVIPARVNGIRMYLLGNQNAAGESEILGATQGYDENGASIRGSIPLEEGMSIRPLFTAVSPDGTEREYEGSEIKVPAAGLKCTWERIPAGAYQYCFGLKDLSGTVHYTDNVPVSF